MSAPIVTPVPDAPAAGWWHRNRWALVALPVALVLTLVAAGDRVRTLWWEQDLRRPTTVAAGETADFHQRVYDGLGGTLPVDVQVRLDGVRDVSTLPRDMEVPEGSRAVQVDLTLSADPDRVLTGCLLAVRDAAGNRYDYVSNAWGANQAVVPCVPEDAPGPRPSLGDLDEVLSEQDTPPRPATWSVSRVLVVPEGIDVTEVVLWWQKPQHLLLEVPS
ncbi:hypothetical protein [Cellulomonas xylanilytica]|uniref:Uncharacterized protein n=1 Tax=Cellulomonas xylanilytica TaxID=233583 RepID=A0A510UYK1_9CELL|nr:hypothetical protein [Cellulomonas xylanilytica]GEK19754.1 hypothetical protein CXY01_02740 [Cellulomonas xylanilytica]